MNTEVNYEIAKLLKDKGFKGSTHANWWILQKDHHENYKKRLPVDESKVFFAKNSYDLDLKIQIDEEREHNVFHVLSAPAIAEVVMWLYEKHGIWIQVISKNTSTQMSFKYEIKRYEWDGCITDDNLYNSPTEANESGIKHVLENLI
jgi:hypothetical protein